MNVLGGHEPPKITGVLRYQNKILFDAPGQDIAIRSTQSAEVARMHDQVRAFGIQRPRDGRRNALIEKQPHRLVDVVIQAAFRHGLPDGRPRSGWALAYSAAASSASRGTSG